MSDLERGCDSSYGPSRRRRSKRPGSGLRWILLLAWLGAAAACAPSHHTVDPYRFDPQEAVRLGFRAARICSAQRPPGSAPPARAFVTDGCSLWPDDARYVDCCVEHDILYWCGGTPEQRFEADDAFGLCVEERTSPRLGSVIRFGVRGGGHPLFPTPWRWGYGDPYRAGYPGAP